MYFVNDRGQSFTLYIDGPSVYFCQIERFDPVGIWCHILILDFRQFAVIISIFQPSKLVVFTIVKYRNKGAARAGVGPNAVNLRDTPCLSNP